VDLPEGDDLVVFGIHEVFRHRRIPSTVCLRESTSYCSVRVITQPKAQVKMGVRAQIRNRPYLHSLWDENADVRGRKAKRLEVPVGEVGRLLSLAGPASGSHRPSATKSLQASRG